MHSTNAVHNSPLLGGLANPLYSEPHRVPKWSSGVSVASCPCSLTAGRLLRKALPGWAKETHLQHAVYHHQRAKKLDEVWAKVWQRAFKEAFGRAPAFGDYHITAIGRDEISERHKRVLRHCAYSASKHSSVARAHERAAGKRKSLEA